MNGPQREKWDNGPIMALIAKIGFHAFIRQKCVWGGVDNCYKCVLFLQDLD